MMEQFSIALIGCGRISYKHVEAIAQHYPRAILTAVCDPVRELAVAKAEEYKKLLAQTGITNVRTDVYTDYREMLAAKSAAIAAIATESGSHAEIALACMKNGLHVLVEKPMALSTTDADTMIACAEQHNVKLCVAHQNRFNRTIQKLRQAVEEGRFGRIVAGNARVLWNRNEDYYTQAPWRGTYEQDGGCLMNQCIHNIDLLQWMLGGDMTEVQAMLANFVHPYIEAEDYGSIQIAFGSGAIGNVEGTVCVYPRNLEETLTILGERGTVVIGGKALNEICAWQFADGKDSLEAVRAECNNEIESVYGWGHTPLYGDLFDSINDNRPPLIDGHEGKKGMSIILHAYEAACRKQRLQYGTHELDTRAYCIAGKKAQS